MARTLSAAAQIAIQAPQTGEVFLVLLVISHASLSPSLYFVNNLTDVTTGGHTYTAYPFTIEIPEESDGAPPTVQLKIDNVSRAITDAIRSLATPPTVTMSVVLASSPATVEAGPFALSLQDMTADAFVVTGTLGFERMLSEPYPGGVYTPKDWPGLFP